MSRLDKPKRRGSALAARNMACLGAVMCCLCSGGGTCPDLIGTPPLGVVTPGPSNSYGVVQDLDKPEVNSPPQKTDWAQPPPCIAESAFFKNSPKGFHWPDRGDELSLRVLEEYGAILVARGGVVAPPVVIFPDRDAVARWQSSLSTEQAELAGIPVRLQSAALQALMKAREEALQAHLAISPRGTDAAQRSYDETLELWRSRVDPGLLHWVDNRLLSAAEADRLRKLPPHEQASEILKLENHGLFFSKDFSKSILFSVAPPGASQHLSMLAFDVKEHSNPIVRSILEHHGWFQTVTSDLPHFTYLGANKHQLPSLGLKMVRERNRVYWIPDIACSPAVNP
ncbi:MAG TPA: hypothetical protein VEO19_12735 [Terriglobia bacterium]|nr:hypothetical protein [Terriglobia bacterium]